MMKWKLWIEEWVNLEEVLKELNTVMILIWFTYKFIDESQHETSKDTDAHVFKPFYSYNVTKRQFWMVDNPNDLELSGNKIFQSSIDHGSNPNENTSIDSTKLDHIPDTILDKSKWNLVYIPKMLTLSEESEESTSHHIASINIPMPTSTKNIIKKVIFISLNSKIR